MQLRAALHRSEHLNESKLEAPDTECPFCGSTNRENVCVLQTNPQVSLLECGNCKAASASRMPTDDALREYYSKYYESIISSDAEQITFDDCQRFADYLTAKFIEYQNKGPITILDFGGGDGSISHCIAVKLLEKGVEGVSITLVDYSEKTVSPQDKHISIVRKDSLEVIDPFYNFVIASAIIEHLPKPRYILDALLNRLKKGGVFYARTPCVVPLMKLLGRIGIGWDFTFPAHLHDLGQEFWESYFDRIISTGDFQVLKSRPSIVETTLNKHFLKTVAAYTLKAPWYLFGRSYGLVGGWEVFVRKSRT